MDTKEATTNRVCARCGVDISHKRKDAKHCTKRCTNEAWKEKNPSMVARHGRTYKENNREKLREYDRTYNENNREKKRERNYAWFVSNPEKNRDRQHRRRVKVRGARGWFSVDEWKRTVERYHHSCAYCGLRCDDLEMDHVTPISKGGRHSMSNILPACKSCNCSKRDKYLSEWRYKNHKAPALR